jgi:PHP family Zn ribbon phosphoesterase
MLPAWVFRIGEKMASSSGDDKRIRLFNADMHIHTCLSPCCDGEMRPKRIIERCREQGLDIIAVCDHNSAGNAVAVIQAGKQHGIHVLPGMEVCSREEVHILTIFKDMEQALAMQAYVYEHLPGNNPPGVFGDQILVDENDQKIGENTRMLIGATELGLHDIVDKAHELKGICIASHVDRPAYGILSQLGFIPPDLMLDGIEVSFRMPLKKTWDTNTNGRALPCVTSSDAHFPDDIGRASTPLMLAAPNLAEIRLALQGKDGRQVEV